MSGVEVAIVRVRLRRHNVDVDDALFLTVRLVAGR